MKAVILSAGVGSRLGKSAKDTPKCLLKLNSRPILERQINILNRCGVKDVSVVVGKEGNCWNKKNHKKIKGICNKVIVNEANISKNRVYSLFKGISKIDKGPIIVIDGDLFFEKAVIDMILESEQETLFLAKEVSNKNPERKILINSKGRITRFGVKGKVKGKAYVNAGMMKIGSGFFIDLKRRVMNRKNHANTISNIIDSLCRKHNLNIMAAKDMWVNLNTPKDIQTAQRTTKKNNTAVLWDLDGVILDTEPLQIKAYKRAFLNQGIKISGRDYSENTGRKDMFQRICKKYNARCDFNKWYKEKNYLYWKQMDKGIKALPGVQGSLKELYAKGYRLALVSSTSRRNLFFILNKLDIRKYFEEVLGFEDTLKGKPSPEPYLNAAKRLGIGVKRCVVIEDTSVGVESAKRAGMKCVIVTGTNRVKQDHSKADVVVRSLNNLNTRKIDGMVGK
ncbi:MAG: HAD-IA family hydrolase [Nanoarchaeota archaeon]|nr:HAD-IA family hydrolase [Nanoarchaeota archaeon]